MLIVEIQNANIHKALKIMRRKIRTTGQLVNLRNGRHFIKKSERKKIVLKKAKYHQLYLDNLD